MQSSAAYAIADTTTNYLSAYPDTPDGVIASNDQSLAFGGTFDIQQTWNPPHTFHYRGTAADMRGNMLSHHIPVSRQQTFVNFCAARGADLAQIEYANPSDSDTYVQDGNRHVHCHWPITN